jgi:hypothetical protein
MVQFNQPDVYSTGVALELWWKQVGAGLIPHHHDPPFWACFSRLFLCGGVT